jgi:hypothetical protein
MPRFPGYSASSLRAPSRVDYAGLGQLQGCGWTRYELLNTFEMTISGSGAAASLV